jgi:hypothetical protein
MKRTIEAQIISRLRTRIKEDSRSMKQIADAVGYHPHYILKITTGQKPLTRNFCNRMSEFFGADIEVLGRRLPDRTGRLPKLVRPKKQHNNRGIQERKSNQWIEQNPRFDNCKNYFKCLDEAAKSNQLFGCANCQEFELTKNPINDMEIVGAWALIACVFMGENTKIQAIRSSMLNEPDPRNEAKKNKKKLSKPATPCGPSRRPKSVLV